MKSIPTVNHRHPSHAKLHMFMAANGRSKNWYGGFYHNGKFLSQSTGTEVYQHALQVADKWFWERQVDLKAGTLKVSKAPTFQQFAEQVPVEMAAMAASPAYIKSTKIVLTPGGYVHAFFGKLEVAKIDSRTWDMFRVWLNDIRIREGKPRLSERTIHQKKNAVRLVLRQAYLRQAISGIPRFVDPYKPKKVDARPRVYFSSDDYQRLLTASWQNLQNHRAKGTRWIKDAEELHHYIIFMVNTGLRVGESRALRVRDVRITKQKVRIKGQIENHEVCGITITGGKCGAANDAISYLHAPVAFRGICKSRGIADPANCDEKLFLKHHHTAFKRLLKEAGLYHDQYGRKRDFVSLRHTYICFRLSNNVSAWQVAQNTRTSVTMIEKHYAKSLSALSEGLNVVL